MMRRDFLLGSAAALASCAVPPRAPEGVPALAPGGVVHDGEPLGAFGLEPGRTYPDVRSFRKKLGILLPATNTSVEHELWRIVFDNREALAGVGLHTTPVITPRPVLKTSADLASYQRQFIDGLGDAIDHAELAQPDRLIMAMSLEHILSGADAVRVVMRDAMARSKAPWSTWHDAAPAALKAYGAKRIGLLTPFDARGNENATRLFEDLGFEVVTSFGFACANALHIAHVPDEAKERAIVERLATPKNRLDAIVQCGTNMSLVDVAEKLEPRLGIPVLGINAVTFWHALRESGIRAPLVNAGRLLREH
jgi:maleate isomerase